MEEMIYLFIEKYGWNLTLIALSGILILGIVKLCHLFDKIEKGKRKYVFTGIMSIFSIVSAAAYLLVIQKFEVVRFVLMSLGIFGINQTIYAIYENCGMRALLRKVGNVIKNAFTKHSIKSSKDVEQIEANSELQDVDIIDDLH